MRDEQTAASPDVKTNDPPQLFRKLFAAGVVLAVVIAGLGLTGSYTEIWDGGYPYVACELTFLDTDGNPVSGVQLEVVRKSGVVRHHWPIDDFYVGRVPVSDENGRLNFHCCGHRFGGTCHTYFHVIKIGGCGAPEYTCNFLQNGELIASVPFNDLAFAPESQISRQERTIRIPTPEQVFGDAPIPAVDDLPETTREFNIVTRSLIVQKLEGHFDQSVNRSTHARNSQSASFVRAR